MIKVINFEDSENWDKIVKDFPNHDIYYMREYVAGFKIHGDGDPVLVVWQDKDISGICVLMLRDISEDEKFSTHIQEKLLDGVTPYGYGGFIFNKKPEEDALDRLADEFNSFLKEQGVISVFFRFHPQLENALLAKDICEVIDLGKTIEMNLSDTNTIWANLTSKNRNMIRKAEKSGVIIQHGQGKELFSKFKEIYEETMRFDNATSYYFFKDDFYDSILMDLKNNHEIFYATVDGKIIAMAIMLFANGRMHYHLSGSIREYRHLAPSNLLLYKAAVWGMEQGYKTLHLGGGIGSGADHLYKFKTSFNRQEPLQFSIGKLITDKESYEMLVAIRKKDSTFDATSHFFPLYRS